MYDTYKAISIIMYYIYYLLFICTLNLPMAGASIHRSYHLFTPHINDRRGIIWFGIEFLLKNIRNVYCMLWLFLHPNISHVVRENTHMFLIRSEYISADVFLKVDPDDICTLLRFCLEGKWKQMTFLLNQRFAFMDYPHYNLFSENPWKTIENWRKTFSVHFFTKTPTFCV